MNFDYRFYCCNKKNINCMKCGWQCCPCCQGPPGPTGPRGCPGQRGPQGEQGVPGLPGLKGQDGKSAYEIAVEKGFEGTEEEWLESLKGTTGPQGEQGAPGLPGLKGLDGKSAYEIAVEKGFEGTEEEWLESLKGATGPQGEPFSRVFGVFHGNPTGPFTDGGLTRGTIIPVTYAGTANTPGAFTINADGSVTVNESGIYLATGRVLTDAGSSGNFVIQINERGVVVGGVGTAGTVSGGTVTITTLLILNEGDRVSNGYIGTNPVYMIPFIQNVRSAASVITLVKLAENPSAFINFEINNDIDKLVQIKNEKD